MRLVSSFSARHKNIGSLKLYRCSLEARGFRNTETNVSNYSCGSSYSNGGTARVMRLIAATCVFASANALRLHRKRGRTIKYGRKPSLFIKLTCAIPHAKYQKCVHYSRCASAISRIRDEAVAWRWHTVRERSDNYAPELRSGI